MASKRKCGFLTTSVAKRIKLPEPAEHVVNSYLMKARDYYAYVHGTPPRHKAYTLCLAAIHNAGDGGSARVGVINQSLYFRALVEEIAEDLLKWESYGVQLSTCFRTISREESLRGQLQSLLCDWEHNNSRKRSMLEILNDDWYGNWDAGIWY